MVDRKEATIKVVILLIIGFEIRCRQEAAKLHINKRYFEVAAAAAIRMLDFKMVAVFVGQNLECPVIK